MLLACECGPWKYSQNVISNGTTAVQNYYLDTQGKVSGTETNNATGVCTEGLRVFDTNKYFFSKEVLQRGLDDHGDCTIMLGEQCANALKVHFLRESVNYIRAGGCPGDGKVEQNTTMPWECAGLAGTSETWFENQLWAAGTYILQKRCASLTSQTQPPTRSPLSTHSPPKTPAPQPTAPNRSQA
jgi:hypothetical protein